MIGSIHCKVCFIAVLISTVPIFGQADQNIVRLDLKDRAQHGPPDTLPAYVEIATVQPDVEQGIVFTLNIENNSAKTIRIMDPIDLTNIILVGFTQPKSKNLHNTRMDSSICKIHSFSPEQIKAIFADKRAKRPFEAFDVDAARRNRSLKTVSDIVLWEPSPYQTRKTPSIAKPLNESERFDARVGGKLTLEPGQQFQAILQITRVHSDYEAYDKSLEQWRNGYLSPGPGGIGTIAPGAPPKPEQKIIPIPAGRYSLFVTIMLWTDNAGSYTATSYSVLSDGITIQLGEPGISKQKNTVMP